MKITVTEEVQTLVMPGRKHLTLRNTGASNLYVGWEPETTAGGATQGVLVEPGEFYAPAGRDLDLSAPLRLVCAAGETTTINYTQKA